MLHAEKVIQGHKALPYWIGFLDGFHHIRFRQRSCFHQASSGRQLRGQRGGKRAPGAVSVFQLHLSPLS